MMTSPRPGLPWCSCRDCSWCHTEERRRLTRDRLVAAVLRRLDTRPETPPRGLRVLAEQVKEVEA